MKRFTALSLAFVALASVSLASAAIAEQPVREVSTRRISTSTDSVLSYTKELDAAVKGVCRDALQPLVGLAYYNYLDCVRRTRADVAATEPTGLYDATVKEPVSLALAEK